MLEPGTILHERYKVNGKVGQGAMAMVFSAHDQTNGKHVAIKQMGMYVDDPAEAELAIAQFEHEAQLLHALQHPNIPRVYEWFQDGNERYLVMDFIEGQPLTHCVTITSKRDVVPHNLPHPRTVVDWAKQITHALQYLHAQQPQPIIYKDLKPDNLMLTKDGRIMLLDFGIAKGRDARGQYKTILKGMVSPGYAAPEQYSGIATDPRTDLYGLGATMYALLSGRVPPQSVDRQQAILSRTPDPLVRLREYNDAISPELEMLVFRLMALKRDQRIQTADQVLNQLDALPESATQTSAVKAAQPNSRTFDATNTIAWVGVVLMLLLFGALAIWYFVLPKPIAIPPKPQRSSARPGQPRSASGWARSAPGRMADVSKRARPG